MKLVVENASTYLHQLAEEADEIKILIAFLTEDGIKWIPKGKEGIINAIVGINLGITSFDCLKRLIGEKAEISIYYQRNMIFHPKAFYFKGPKKESLFIGSHNLTGSALESNYEMSIILERNKESELIFTDFLAQFQYLKYQSNCFTPNAYFFDKYNHIGSVNTYKKVEYLDIEGFFTEKKDILSFPDNIAEIKEFITLVSQEFPKLDRKSGQTIKDHPLKMLNDNSFLPFFAGTIAEITNNRFKATSTLNIGGNWYSIPNIFIESTNREPWENTYKRGRLIIQIHYSADYTRVYMSLILQYNKIKGSDSIESIEERVQNRYNSIIRHLDYSNENEHMPDFKHWSYKNEVLYAKSIKSYEYFTNQLPDDHDLYYDLIKLISTYEATVSIE